MTCFLKWVEAGCSCFCLMGIVVKIAILIVGAAVSHNPMIFRAPCNSIYMKNEIWCDQWDCTILDVESQELEDPTVHRKAHFLEKQKFKTHPNSLGKNP